MERYIINGKEFEFDTFDMDNLELIQRETKRLEENTRKFQRNGNAFQFIRERAEDMLDFFDTVVGEGTSAAAFGNKVNVKEIMCAYKQFTKEVGINTKEFFDSMTEKASPANREQRRAADREQRRAEVRQRAPKP